MGNKIRWFLFIPLLISSLVGNAQRYFEQLNRGLVAVRTSSENVFLSWRSLGSDLDSTGFNVYCNDELINTQPIYNVTYHNHSISTNGVYYIKSILNGIEQETSEPISVWGQNYLDINLNRPPGGTTPPYTVTNRNVVESYPDGQDYTYSPNDCSVGDVDGDGEYELIVKWDPSNSRDNSFGGITGNVIIDAYEMDGTQLWRIDLGINIRAGAHYTQFLVYDFDNDGKAEVAFKTAPGTKDGSDSFLSLGPAATDNDSEDYRNSQGRVLSGPEYLTIFNGETGLEMSTINFEPQRGNVCDWGDCYGNRVDRFLATVAYLDGINPSLVMCRGYYAKTVLAAYNWDGTSLSEEWIFNSHNGYPSYSGQGNHNLSVADVDDDGKDEIIYGSCTIDNDGTGLYSTGLGHGDALHVTDHNPEIPGLEVFMPHENKKDGITLRKASSGEIIWQKFSNTDVGRGLAADVTASSEGSEFWASSGLGMYDVSGQKIGSIPSINFAVWWDGDDTRELLDGNRITKYGSGTLLNASGCSSNNGTKSTPSLQADILGDWREEVIFRTSDNTKLRIYTTTSTTSRKQYTLMHDPVYRLGISWQNVAYNQPPHTGFHFGNGMQEPPFSPIRNNKTVWVSGTEWDVNTSQNWEINGKDTVFLNNEMALFDISGTANNPINISGEISPSSVQVFSPHDYTFSGSGKLTGKMPLKKNGPGILTIENENDYTGETKVWGGTLNIVGKISASKVSIFKHASLTGAGSLHSVELYEHAKLYPGSTTIADSMHILNNLILNDGSHCFFDLSDDTSGFSKTNDFIKIEGDVVITGRPVFHIDLLNDSLSSGTYKLLECSGISGNIDSIIVKNINGTPYELISGETSILLNILPRRAADHIIWKGVDNNTWDLAQSKNWLLNEEEVYFIQGDSVTFSDSGNPNNTVNLKDTLIPSLVIFNHSVPYTIQGEGQISGPTGLIKTGSGKLSIENTNIYTGATIINNGEIEIDHLADAGHASVFGMSGNSGTNLIFNGGTLSFTNLSGSTNRDIYLEPGGGSVYLGFSNTLTYNGSLSGPGFFSKTGGGKLIIKKANSHSGGTNIKAGELYLATEDAITYGLGNGPVTIENGTLSMLNNNSGSSAPWNIIVPTSSEATLKLDENCQLTGTLTGGGILNIYSPGQNSELLGDWSEFSGTINVTTDENGGWFLLGNKNGFRNTSLNLTGKIVALYRHSSNDTIDIGQLVGTSDSRLGAGGEGDNTITWKVGALGTSSVFNGTITEIQYRETNAKTSIIKTGQGNLTLNGASSYTGLTIIEDGTLTLNNTSGSGTGTGNVIVQSGGTLSGTGVISGKVTVESNGVISPGDKNIDSLKILNNLKLLSGSYYYSRINTDNMQSDMLVVKDTIEANGILYFSVNGTNELQKNDSLKILHAGYYSGGFSSIVPAYPAKGLAWDTSSLAKDGFIRVKKEGEILATNVKKNEQLVHLYPNPCRNRLFIQLKENFNNAKVSIKTVGGQYIFTQELLSDGNITEINLKNLRNGIYLATFILDNKVFSRQLILNR
jgi:autotransporter-associated beta strand protein